MSTPLENARAQLEAAQRTFAAASPDLEARLEAANSIAEVDAVQKEIDDAQAPVLIARKRVEKFQSLEEARSSNPLIPTGDTEDERRSRSIRVTREPRTYEPFSGPSFLTDLWAAQKTGDREAIERLQRNNAEVRESLPVEARASLTTSDFYRPIYAADQWVPTYRPRMVFAGLVKQLPLASFGETVTIPKYTAPTDASSFQAGDNAALTTNAGSTSQLSTVVVTAGGYCDVSRQAVERAAPGLDEVIFGDIARDIARKTEIGCLTGGGTNAPNGILLDSNVPAVTVTGQTIAQFLLKLADLSQRIETAIGESPDFILMHPRRWAFLESLVDSSTNRPVIVPSGQGPFNAFGTVAPPDNSGQGLSLTPDTIPVGYMLGLPVYTSASIPTTNGAGTNEDWVLIGIRDLAVHWYDPAGYRSFAFEAVASSTLSIRLQTFTYTAYIHRVPTAYGIVKGLTTPTF